MRNLVMFGVVVMVAYVVGRHLVPSTAVDAALVWTFDWFSLSADAVLLG